MNKQEEKKEHWEERFNGNELEYFSKEEIKELLVEERKDLLANLTLSAVNIDGRILYDIKNLSDGEIEAIKREAKIEMLDECIDVVCKAYNEDFNIDRAFDELTDKYKKG